MSDSIDTELTDELKPFLNNIRKGMMKFGVQGFNAKLKALVDLEEDEDEIISLIIFKVCEEYNTTERAVFQKYPRGDAKDAIDTCICLLHFGMGLTVRKISKYVFKRKYFKFVQLALSRHKKLNTRLKPDREYKDRYDKLYAVLKHRFKNA